ncbi:P-loop containing nucleoside triphosphate hydrolase protein, partial [Rhizodiscina lignyota]
MPALDNIAAAKRFKLKPSTAKEEWEKHKQQNEHITNEEWAQKIDQLMALVGLEEVKAQFLSILAKIDTCRDQQAALNSDSDKRFNVIFQGNPGTGKTTVALIYGEFMHLVGALESKKMKNTTGAKLAYRGPKGAKKSIKKLLSDSDGGTLFVDEAYQLVAPHSSNQGRQALDVILTEMENNIEKLLAIFAGYKSDMEAFFEHNPGLASRIPYTLTFADFSDDELWKIMCDKIEAKYGGRMKVDDDMGGLYMHIAIRRLGLGRGSKSFGNARAVENLLATISERQALRIRNEVRKHKNDQHNHGDPDRFFFKKEDLIGPDPSQASKDSQAWKELEKLIGLDSVKKSVKQLFRMIEFNYKRELAERNPVRVPLNQVFVGNPGTGKTTVARLYGQILADLGLLSRGDVVLKNPSDFIGDAVGKSEANTRAILASTVGKVLVIDEAYMLHPGDMQTDSYRSGVIDTIVAEVQGVLGEDRAIILVGYEDKLKNMFHHANPGLSRRFPIESPFRFDNFTVSELENIMRKKMKEQDLDATDDAYEVARGIFERALMRPNFSNAGEVERLMADAKMNYESRYANVDVLERPFEVVFESQDIDPNFNRTSAGVGTCRKLLEGRVGENVIVKLERFQKLSIVAHKRGLDPRDWVPTNFIFKGPPGTGKTTAALEMGKIFYDIGFLSTSTVVSCTSSDLIGQYIGQTAPKTKLQLQKALGKVLVIEEAQQLKEPHYASEAANELIQFLSMVENKGRIVVVLVGLTDEMNQLMAARPGLSGLFTEEIKFENIGPDKCVSLLNHELQKGQVEAPFLEDPSSTAYKKVLEYFNDVNRLSTWSNAHHIQALAKSIGFTHLQEMVDNTASD